MWAEAGWGLSRGEGDPGLRQDIGNLAFPKLEEERQRHCHYSEGDEFAYVLAQTRFLRLLGKDTFEQLIIVKQCCLFIKDLIFAQV